MILNLLYFLHNRRDYAEHEDPFGQDDLMSYETGKKAVLSSKEKGK